MTTSTFWPSNASAIVLWSEVISVWGLASYALAPDTNSGRLDRRAARRARLRLTLASIAAALGVRVLMSASNNGSTSLALPILTGALVGVTNYGRRRLPSSNRGKHYLAEWEISANAVLVVASAILIGWGKLSAPVHYPGIQTSKFAAVFAVAAAIAFTFRGGTYVVRGLLDKTNAVPLVPLSGQITSEPRVLDVSEFNRGRSIGNLERLLMVIVISLGSYEALGFLIAAKGLIRVREFEDRNFAEYFILGSLTSASVAFVVGIALRAIVTYLWALLP